MSSSLQTALEGRIDFQGQQTTEQIARTSLTIITTRKYFGQIVSFIIGFVMQSLSVTFIILTASTLVLGLVVLPPWPMYNRHPVKWLPVQATKKSQ